MAFPRMTDWRTHLTPDEAKRIAEIDRLKRDLLDERATLHNRAKQRRHRKAAESD